MMRLIRDERGMTSAGMAVAILVCLALVFSSAQVYRVNSASAEVQDVADAAVLAAENEVAEFMIAVQVCDATILSMTLLAGTVIGLGVVAACVPPLFPLSEQLISVGSKIVKARNNFSETACKGLDGLQKLLPFLAAANAAAVSAANNSDVAEATYLGLGVLVPAKGEPIVPKKNEVLDKLDFESNKNADKIREKSEAAEAAAKEARDAKMEAFMADCGAEPERCQYERAAKLSSIKKADNPLYESVDTWSFSVAFNRAKAYFLARQNETEPETSVSDKASYHLRMRYYRYVSYELSKGFVRENLDEPEIYLPKIFKNTAEFSDTVLFTECNYAVSSGGADGGGGIIHAYDKCPAIGTVIGRGSVAQLQLGTYTGCSTCGFEVESMGNIASASTNIPTGFEHHYEKIRQASERYKKAMQQLAPLKEDVKSEVSPLLELVKQLLSEIGGGRIYAKPPGSAGCIALVVNVSDTHADTGFESSFVRGSTTLGTRAAISGATLVEDTGHDSSSLITSLLDGFGQNAGATIGASRIVLDVWSKLLKSYENGQTALSGALEKGLSSFSIVSISGIGKWASNAFKDVVVSAGLEPARLKAQKAVVLNTGHVANADNSQFAVTFKKVKSTALSASDPSGNLFNGIVDCATEKAIEAVNETTVTIAEIEFPVGDKKIPITVSLPESTKKDAVGLIGRASEAVKSAVAAVSRKRVWQ